jgi:DNA-binding Lrp family transcriptional regulator
MELDRIDSAILAALQNNARLSNKELAGRVGLAPSTCLERVRRLFDAGVLLGAHARVDPEALGIRLQAMIGVRLRQHSRDEVLAFRAEMIGHREVVAVYYLAGVTDFLVHVAVRDAAHLRDFALDAITARADVARVETSLLFEHSRDAEMPDYRNPPAGADGAA